MKSIKNLYSPILKKAIVQNSAWIIFAQIAQLACSFFLTILISRYLGPENYGLLSYGATLTSFFSIIAKLGIDSIIVNEIIANKEKTAEIIGSSIYLRIISSIISILLMTVLIFILKNDSKIIIITSIIQSISIIFLSANVFDGWFQSDLKSKYSSIAKITAYLFTAAFKILLIIFNKSLYWFAASTIMDALIVVVISFIFYKRNKQQKLKISKLIAKKIFKKSYHFILSGILVYIYTQTDKIMIAQILNNKELGYYSASLNICHMLIFVPNAILISLRVSIFNAKKNFENYLKKIKQTYIILFSTSIIISIFTTFFSEIIIGVLYGENFDSSIQNLKILTWYLPFSILGMARGIWVITENKNKYVKKYALIGVILNIILNFILIPKIGINGAAIATVITEFITCFIAPMFFRETRKHTKILIEALLFKFDDELNLSTKQIRNTIIGKISPKLLSKILYKEHFNKKLNLKNPESLNEKLMWLKLNNYAENPLVWQCADKYRVREYIKSKGITEKYLPEIIKTYTSAKEINFDELPNKFALKCTHGCGFNIICTNKQKLNKKEAIKKLNKWQKTNFGLKTAEPHYSHIKPIIICEGFIENKEYEWPADYKIHCINGKPMSITVNIDRNTDHKLITYSTDWIKQKVFQNEATNIDIKKPKSLQKMISISKKLSKDFPFIRIDFYENNGKPIIGEMTFTPGACLLPWTKEASMKYGKMLKIEKSIK